MKNKLDFDFVMKVSKQTNKQPPPKAMYGARWTLEISGELLCKVYGCLNTMLIYLKLIQNNIECKL